VLRPTPWGMNLHHVVADRRGDTCKGMRDPDRRVSWSIAPSSEFPKQTKGKAGEFHAVVNARQQQKVRDDFVGAKRI
jgi:hypothetical protein